MAALTQQTGQTVDQSEQLNQDQTSVPFKIIQQYFVQSSHCSGGYLAYRFEKIPNIKHEDTIFVSIYTPCINIKQFAISVLDTRDLRSRRPGPNENYSCIIKSYQYHTTSRTAEEIESKKNSQYIEKKWVPSLLNNILCTGSPDPDANEEPRVFLVSNLYGFDLISAASKMAPIVKVPVVDIVNLWHEIDATVPEVLHLPWYNILGLFRGAARDCVWNADLTLRLFLKMVQDADDLQMWGEGYLIEDEQRRSRIVNSVVEADRHDSARKMMKPWPFSALID